MPSGALTGAVNSHGFAPSPLEKGRAIVNFRNEVAMILREEDVPDSSEWARHWAQVICCSPGDELDMGALARDNDFSTLNKVLHAKRSDASANDGEASSAQRIFGLIEALRVATGKKIDAVRLHPEIQVTHALLGDLGQIEGVMDLHGVPHSEVTDWSQWLPSREEWTQDRKGPRIHLALEEGPPASAGNHEVWNLFQASQPDPRNTNEALQATLAGRDESAASVTLPSASMPSISRSRSSSSSSQQPAPALPAPPPGHLAVSPELPAVALSKVKWGSGLAKAHSTSLVTPIVQAIRTVVLKPLYWLSGKIEGSRSSGPRYYLAGAINAPLRLIDASLELAAGAASLVEEVALSLPKLAGAGIAHLLGADRARDRLLQNTRFDPRTKPVFLSESTEVSSELLEHARRHAQILDADPKFPARDQPDVTPLARERYEGRGIPADKPDAARLREDYVASRREILMRYVPGSVVRIGDGGDGSVLKLELHDKTGVLTGGHWSPLAVKMEVFHPPAAPDGTPAKPQIHLCFYGVNHPEKLKSAAAVSVLGIADSQLTAATQLVAEFVKKHGAENVSVSGHSFGGALATFAGVKNGVPVVTVNGLGLHPHHVKMLGASRLKKANVLNIHWEDDGVILAGKNPTTQIGTNYVVSAVPEGKARPSAGRGDMSFGDRVGMAFESHNNFEGLDTRLATLIGSAKAREQAAAAA